MIQIPTMNMSKDKRIEDAQLCQEQLAAALRCFTSLFWPVRIPRLTERRGGRGGRIDGVQKELISFLAVINSEPSS